MYPRSKPVGLKKTEPLSKATQEIEHLVKGSVVRHPARDGATTTRCPS
jgi:hypothetical protein